MQMVSPTRRMASLSIATSIATLVLKFGAWWVTGSMGLLSDALETLVNVAAAVIALLVLSVAEKPADEDHAYGHEKAEYFSSAVEGVLILAAAVAIAVAAAIRLRHPAELQSLGPGLVIALLATALNFWTAKLMLRVAKDHDSIAVEADARHLMADVATSLGVSAGLILVLWFPAASILDPLIALGVAGHIAMTGWDLVRRSIDGLMDRALPHDEIHTIRTVLAEHLHNGHRVFDLKSRRAGSRRFLEFNLRVPAGLTVREAHDACDLLEEALKKPFSGMTVMIHIEPHDVAAEERGLK
jgi:cation diffusion facilitator family transporter